MMKKSPVHPKYEASYYDSYGFDLQEDFSQFLEEARHYEMTEAKLKNSSSVHPEEGGGGGGGKKEGPSEKEGKKKKKKSWKSSVVSWWKAEKKSKLREGPTTAIDSKAPKGSSGKKQGHFSGPLYNSGKAPSGRKPWRPSSGPLITGLFFKSTKTHEENEIPYVSLHQQEDSPQALDNYGPLYIVS